MSYLFIGFSVNHVIIPQGFNSLNAFRTQHESLTIIMASRGFVVANEVFHHRNGNILTPWELLNCEKQFFLFKFTYINEYFYTWRRILITENMIYTDPCNFLTKRALVSQQSTLVVAKDSNISHYLILSIRQRLSFSLYHTHPPWLSPTNELKFDD